MKAFSSEMRTATYIAAVCFAVSLLTWQRDPPFKGPPGSGKPPGGEKTRQMDEGEGDGVKQEEDSK